MATGHDEFDNRENKEAAPIAQHSLLSRVKQYRQQHSSHKRGTMKELKTSIKQILEKAQHYEWSLQGFGMLRLYLTKETRLHVWSDTFAVPNVSDIHDHPWHFKSTVIAGSIRNTRFLPIIANDVSLPPSQRYLTRRILCGNGGCVMGEVSEVGLWTPGEEVYGEGFSYSQSASEIHRSEPADGTVTIITRTFLDDPDHANVFWRQGEEWVSAEPRPATPEEVKAITGNALRIWF